MPKVLFVDDKGREEMRDMAYLPAIGDLVSVFSCPFPKVRKLEEASECKNIPNNIDIVITMEKS